MERVVMAVESFSARTLIDLFSLLSKEERENFLKLLGQRLLGEEPLLITSEMPLQEKEKYLKLYLSPMMGVMFPILAKTAGDMARVMPMASNDDLGKAINKTVMDTFNEYGSTIAKVELDKAKIERDRKSDPEIIKRNVHICDLRISNPGKWTQGKLSKHFKISPQGIRKILSEEAEWRQKLARLSTN
jgi:hypothetical protein